MFKFIKSLLNIASSKIAVIPDGYLLIPSTPSEEHLQSMCIRFDHSHNIKHDFPVVESQEHFMQRRRFNRSIVLQLYEEATGQGFYKLDKTDWMQRDDYLNLAVVGNAPLVNTPSECLSHHDLMGYNPKLRECIFIDGHFHHECVVCDTNSKIDDPLAFDPEMHYCGRSDRCIP